LGLGKGLTSHHKKQPVTKCYIRPWKWLDSFEQLRQQKTDDIWNMEGFEILQDRFTKNSTQQILEV